MTSKRIKTSGFTPPDIQYLFQQVAHFAFEQELATQKNYLVTAETFIHLTPKVLPSLSNEVIEEFEKGERQLCTSLTR